MRTRRQVFNSFLTEALAIQAGKMNEQEKTKRMIEMVSDVKILCEIEINLIDRKNKQARSKRNKRS